MKQIRGGSKKWCYYNVNAKVRIQVDVADLPKVKKRTWRLLKDRTKRLKLVTSVRTKRGTRNIHLARYLIGAPEGQFVCLRDCLRPFDFRRSNIVVCSIKDRQRMNPKRQAGGTSKYRGVSLSRGKWRAGIQVNGKSYNLGAWDCEETAARAYNEASRRFFGEIGFQNEIAGRGSALRRA